jgi:SAM-dependent methyltransferase
MREDRSEPMGEKLVPSSMDNEFYKVIRSNIISFMTYASKTYIHNKNGRLLDIAPQDHEGAKPFFPSSMRIDTLDINPQSGCTYICDICRKNDHLIADNSYDYVLCTEVLEHTLQPFDAIEEIRRILKPGGMLFLTVPFNFRIHGPLPDCWRFTEHGLRAILSSFKINELKSREAPDRPLMPIHYSVIAAKPE